MRPSLRLGRIAGVNVGVHWSILVIAFLLVTTLSGSVLPGSAPGYAAVAYLITALATAGLFLASIVAHELGHSVVAQRNGVRVEGITLFALGGVASLDGEAATPGAAARIAAAGPAVSIATGVGLLGAAVAGNAVGLLPGLVVAGLAWLGVINLTLAVFNLLPALPLDGGRVLQAALWRRRGDRHEATISAARLGRWIGWALVLFGFWELSRGANGLITALIGWFVITTAKAEARQARRAQQAEQGPQPLFPFPPFPWAPPSGPPATGPGFPGGSGFPGSGFPGSGFPGGSGGPGGSGAGGPGHRGPGYGRPGQGGFGPYGPTPPQPGPGGVIEVDGRPVDARR